MSGITVLVCGGRDYRNWRKVCDTLDDIDEREGINTIVCGGASGADKDAEFWAELRRAHCNIHMADWDTYGKDAGPRRNAEMLANSKPDLVVAFPGGRGTADMVRRARAAGVRVVEVVEPVTAGGV